MLDLAAGLDGLVEPAAETRQELVQLCADVDDHAHPAGHEQIPFPFKSNGI